MRDSAGSGVAGFFTIHVKSTSELIIKSHTREISSLEIRRTVKEWHRMVCCLAWEIDLLWQLLNDHVSF